MTKSVREAAEAFVEIRGRWEKAWESMHAIDSLNEELDKGFSDLKASLAAPPITEITVDFDDFYIEAGERLTEALNENNFIYREDWANEQWMASFGADYALEFFEKATGIKLVPEKQE